MLTILSCQILKSYLTIKVINILNSPQRARCTLACASRTVGRWIRTFSWCPVSVTVGVLAAAKLRWIQTRRLRPNAPPRDLTAMALTTKRIDGIEDISNLSFGYIDMRRRIDSRAQASRSAFGCSIRPVTPELATTTTSNIKQHSAAFLLDKIGLGPLIFRSDKPLTSHPYLLLSPGFAALGLRCVCAGPARLCHSFLCLPEKNLAWEPRVTTP